MRPRSGRGFGSGGRLGILVGALALVGALGVPAGRAGAQSPETVVITGEDLAWPRDGYGSMTWIGFGGQVSGDPKCRPEPIGGPITAIRFELAFDFATDPPALTGTFAGSGEWQSEAADDPGYGQEWGSWSFSGPIAGGWTRETPEGWAWGGSADLSLEFGGKRLCSIDLDESLQEVYVFAEGTAQRQLTVEFSAGAFGGGYHGFGLDGSSAEDWETGEDVWYMSLGCTRCDVPVPLPVGSGETPGGDGGEEPSGDETVSSAANPPAGGEGQSNAQSDQGETGDDEDLQDAFPFPENPGKGWSPLGVLILILLLIAVVGLTVPEAVRQVLDRFRSGQDLPLTSEEQQAEVVTLAHSARAHLARDGNLPPDFRKSFTPSQPEKLRTLPREGKGVIHDESGAEVTLNPGESYEVVGVKWTDGADGSPNWYEVRVGDRLGWVPKGDSWVSSVTAGTQEAPPLPGWQVVQFSSEFRVREPSGPESWVSKKPGQYRLGNENAEGLRPVYTPRGRLLGFVAPGDVPPFPSPLTQGPAPPAP